MRVFVPEEAKDLDNVMNEWLIKMHRGVTIYANAPNTGIACLQSIVARNEMTRLELAIWRRKFARDVGSL